MSQDSASFPLSYSELGDKAQFPISILNLVGGDQPKNGAGGDSAGGDSAGGRSAGGDNAVKKAKQPKQSRLEQGFGVLGIATILDLLTFYPNRYIDRRNFAKISDIFGQLRQNAQTENEVVVLGEITKVEAQHRLGGHKSWQQGQRKARCNITVADDTGSITCIFFNQPWRANQLNVGMEVHLSGKIKLLGRKLTMANPMVDPIGDKVGKIVPIYPQSAEAKQLWLDSGKVRECIEEALRRSQRRGFADPVPQKLRRQFKLSSRGEALSGIHFPQDFLEQARARERLAFDELLRAQVWLFVNKLQKQRAAGGFSHQPAEKFQQAWYDSLPFKLTSAQERAIKEIAVDMAKPWPMQRLLQGDVGSGKTAVGVAAMLTAVGSGHQAAIMAPTEVLAEQIYFTTKDYMARCVAEDGSSLLKLPDSSVLQGERDLRLALLTSSLTAAERSAILKDLAEGRIDIVVGTHALIQADVAFKSLGLVVIDEQQRFGVEQRAVLQEQVAASGATDEAQSSSPIPDLLVMTGTPIPRTTAMTILGDLDITELDEMPSGRTSITTSRVRTDSQVAKMWEEVRAELRQGRQAFVVCPVIHQPDEPHDRLAWREGAIATYHKLRQNQLADCKVGLLHGQMKTDQKESIMAQFRSKQIEVLVATTIVEVGVDVPNATAMVILDAPQFGLAQLHQLRGRVGRGKHPSKCFLVGEAPNEEGEKRLDALTKTVDGFELAKLDLEIRGEGTVMGDRQSGRGSWKLVRLTRDEQLVGRVRMAAEQLVTDDPTLEGHPDLWEEVQFMLRDEATEFLHRT